MPDSQTNNIKTNDILRWISGIASAAVIPMAWAIFSSLSTVKESSIRMEGKFDVLDMRLREQEHTNDRTNKRLEYLEQKDREHERMKK